MIWTTQAPKMGDIIRVKVKFYHHYGIYLDDEHIVQFGLPDNTGLDPETIAVTVTDMDGFRMGKEPETAKLTPMEKLKRYSPKKTKELNLQLSVLLETTTLCFSRYITQTQRLIRI